MSMDVEEFYDQDPRRRASDEIEFGREWSENGQRFEVAWIADTGEVYVMAEPYSRRDISAESVTVEVLAVIEGETPSIRCSQDGGKLWRSPTAWPGCANASLAQRIRGSELSRICVPNADYRPARSAPERHVRGRLLYACSVFVDRPKPWSLCAPQPGRAVRRVRRVVRAG